MGNPVQEQATKTKIVTPNRAQVSHHALKGWIWIIFNFGSALLSVKTSIKTSMPSRRSATKLANQWVNNLIQDWIFSQ